MAKVVYGLVWVDQIPDRSNLFTWTVAVGASKLRNRTDAFVESKWSYATPASALANARLWCERLGIEITQVRYREREQASTLTTEGRQ